MGEGRALCCSSVCFRRKMVVQLGSRDVGPDVRGRLRLCGPSRAPAVFTVVGVLLAAIGACLAPFWPSLFNYVLSTELSISPTSASFKLWRDTPVPMKLDFYFWNWTNPGEITNRDTKPTFVQMGPYRFNEVHEKINITWHDNGTVSYRQIRRWFFDPDNSNGTLDDEVTTLNIIALTASFVTREWSFVMRKGLDIALWQMGQKLHVTHQVRQLLFEGYESPLITMADRLPALAGIDIPYDRFGWFYSRNGSADFDGVFNMRTGADDLYRVGELARWNYDERTRYFPGRCGNVEGSAGELWPPKRSKDDRIGLFSPDLCRSIELDFRQEDEVLGLRGFRYSGGPSLLDNGTLDPANECFCAGECVASGVLNVSSCRYGAPAFVSYPHFYLADERLPAAVHGMSPEEQRHSFYVTLEPETGIPLDVAARFQINILLQQQSYISMLRGVPRVFFPMLWFEERASITEELARPLRLLLLMPTCGLAASLASCAAGVVALLIATGLRLREHRARTRLSKSAAVSGAALEVSLPLMDATDKASSEKLEVQTARSRLASSSSSST
ncbi:protein croquemort-like isoform X1 [Schistocerca americana]|uniref:protein croquemort-like isoform X1 n=2 Tax=Schistocerca americana TaxID=7009 RepID=UPI001F500A11|nr:protein croquemort-like isoform X1 [Schistocerca americana]